MIEETVYFSSDNFKLHGNVAYNEDIICAPAALLCPPHPQLGGNMNNNVILSIYEKLVNDNFVSLRFDYQGVGKSEGDAALEVESLKSFWDGSSSPLDLPRQKNAADAFNFLKKIQGIDLKNIFLIGYSFGAYAALQIAANEPNLSAIVLVAPTIHFHDFSLLQALTIPKLLIWSDNDFSCPLTQYEQVYDSAANPKLCRVFKEADHFFIGHEDALSKCVSKYLQRNRNE